MASSGERPQVVVGAVHEQEAAVVHNDRGHGRAMRWGEVVGLRLGSVDWRRMISVTETVVEVAGHTDWEPTKTEAGRRTVTLSGFVMEALAEHVEKWPPGETGLIFHDRNGQPVRRSTFYRSWRKATERAGPSGFTVRNLRHTGPRWRWRVGPTWST